jgi:hypothetical protein
MNAIGLGGNTPANASNTGSSFLKPMLGIVIFIAVLVGLYYLYNFLYGSSASQATVQILPTSLLSMDATKQIDTDSSGQKTEAVHISTVSGIPDGGTYSVSFWVYVADSRGFANAAGSKLAHLLEISNKRFPATGETAGNTLLFVGLNPVNGSLIVRQSTSDGSEEINNSITTGFTNTKYPLSNLITAYNSSEFYTSNDKCDITNGIEYQRWVLISVVANGRTLDVYLDGKLARSCVYKAGYALGGNGKAAAIFGQGNGTSLKGFFTNGNFYNYALTPDAIWALYQAGPKGYFNISQFFSNLFNVNISFGGSEQLNTPAASS